MNFILLPWGISTIKDLAEFVAYVVAILSILAAVFTYIFSRKQFEHNVMISCIERFQQIIPDLESDDPQKKINAVPRYLDLCNEELFYFKNKYVPKEVEKEWLDGMISYLPIFINELECLSKGPLSDVITPFMLQNYPRIRKTFISGSLINLEDPKARAELIKQISKRVNKLNYPCS